MLEDRREKEIRAEKNLVTNLEFPMVELPSRRVVISEITLSSYSTSLQGLHIGVALV